jgi:hypothetical protein
VDKGRDVVFVGRPAASMGAAAGRVSVWRRDSGARHGFTVAKRKPATRVRVVWGLRPLSVLYERRASVHYFLGLGRINLYSSDTVEGPRAPAIKLTASLQPGESEGCSS